MGDLTKDFSRSEFACKCGCGFDTVDIKTVQALQKLRRHYDRRVTVTSGCRCDKWNKLQDGGARSQHLVGRAADFVIEDIKSSIVQDWIDNNLPEISMGRYDDFTHIDTRSGDPVEW